LHCVQSIALVPAMEISSRQRLLHAVIGGTSETKMRRLK